LVKIQKIKNTSFFLQLHPVSFTLLLMYNAEYVGKMLDAAIVALSAAMFAEADVRGVHSLQKAGKAPQNGGRAEQYGRRVRRVVH